MLLISDSLSDIESSDDVMQACDAGSAVATFSELEENYVSMSPDGAMQSTDLGISMWGGRCVGDFKNLI